MANTAGGRIFYGVDEQELGDGSTVAGPIRPLTDGTVDSRLEDVLLASIHPRPRFRMRKIPVNSGSGFVLVVEIYPAYASDLHMVTGFKESRFYKRGEQRTVLMTEPEVREAYIRIAASRQTLETTIRAAVDAELDLVPATDESVLIIPWFGHREMVNPQQLGSSFGRDLLTVVRGELEWTTLVERLAVVSDGYRFCDARKSEVHECQSYACVRRTGLVHFARLSAREYGGGVRLWQTNTLETLIAAISTARYVFDKCSYLGPARIVHRVKVGSPFFWVDPMKGADYEILSCRKPIPAGTYLHSIAEVNLHEHGESLKVILRDLLHQTFQTGGEAACPWFEPSGDLKAGMKNFLRPDAYKHLCT